MAIKDAAGNTIAWVTVAGTLETAQRFVTSLAYTTPTGLMGHGSRQ
jgi:hypothetical protein